LACGLIARFVSLCLKEVLPVTRQPNLLVAAILALAINSAAQHASADVVFGNLDTSGTGALGTTNTDIGPTANDYLAQGFTAASPNLIVTSISLGLFGDGSIPSTVSIFADNFGAPAATPLFTSSVTNVGAKGTYAFSFTGANLTNGSNYWVIPQSDVSWYLNSPGSAPTAQNSSGYVFTNTLENLGGGGWSTAGSNRYSISVQAVPEPTTYAMAAAAAGLLGLAKWRRRQA
jgi:hypothetical protein